MLSIERVAEAVGAAWRFLTGETDTAREAITRVFEDNFDGLIIIAEDGHVMAASKVASQLLLGNEGGSLIGRTASELLPDPILRAVQQCFADGRKAVPSPMTLARIGDPRDGYIVQYVVTLSELEPRNGPLPRRVVHLTFWDETERRRREEELAFIGTHDHLTGALTRSELIKIVNAALSGDRRRASGLTMLMVDLHRFKAVNDTLGHARGDMLLKLVVSRLKAAGMETVARLGGDVFAMIRHGRLSPEETQSFCQGLLDRLALPYSLGGQRAIVGASIGLTHTETSGYDPEVLMGHADMALSTAKEMPGNNFVRFTPEMDQRLKERQVMDLALRQARERRQLSIIYQPQCALETGALVGVEALVRWNHPELGVVTPDRFIPAAEENGEIVEIGRWVLQEACREAASWPFQTRLAVNVSPVQFEFVDVVAEVREALSLSGLPAHRLDIEITEGIFVSKAPFIIDALHRLRSLGVGIALDDFGTGYSSLSYLGRLPVDKIKIDKSFVANLPGDAESGAIIRAVMTLSETLNKVVIAEGVENADQAWMLRMMGCRIGQGYHFGRPRSGAEMAAWFEGEDAGQSEALPGDKTHISPY
jgi:diguanylate cyclase (GGDEF)-like protein